MEAFFSDTALRLALRSELKHVPDLHRLSRRFSAHTANLQVCEGVRVFVCEGVRV